MAVLVLADQKLVELARKVDQVNPKQKEATDIFEVTGYG
jgi:hypothetical protein